ncbi:MAG: RnfABCDGE type electron transport complex subunit D [Bacteroidales bacterium]|nr:RnfABCDGE type electron transport complex subunit D [Bacteroidales bacterium]
MYNFIEHTSPHIRRRRTAEMCMWHVIIALAPTTLCAFYFFGLPAFETVLVAVCSCVVIEWAIAQFLMGNPRRESLVAAGLTGLLLALNLPASMPWWAIILGAVVAIGIGKMCFGGLGCNIFNPALVGRVFLLISFPAAMTTWMKPGWMFEADASTGATLLTALKQGHVPDSSYQYFDLFIGNRGGSLGEVASLALLLGFAYLLIVRVISWRIPISILATVIVFDLCLGIQAGLDVLSGGLLLGAIFMATDYVTSPMSNRGMIIFGICIGIITVCIRRWGAYPEGVSFAILIMNGFTPLINRYTRPRRFGYVKPQKTAAA